MSNEDKLKEPDFAHYELLCVAGHLNEARAEGYLRGYKAALHLYAHWQDGIQYVGTSGKTLTEALVDAERLCRARPKPKVKGTHVLTGETDPNELMHQMLAGKLGQPVEVILCKPKPKAKGTSILTVTKEGGD